MKEKGAHFSLQYLRWAWKQAGSPPHRRWLRSGLAILTMGGLIWLSNHTGVVEIPASPSNPLLLLADPKPASTDWPGYRGRTQQGLVSPPSPVQELAMLEPLPGWPTALSGGDGGPCLWGHQFFLFHEAHNRQSPRLTCHDRESGQLLWECSLPGDLTSKTTPSATGPTMTPACDGHCVYVPTTLKGEVWLTAVSLSGRREWSRAVGPYWSEDSYRVSPALHGSLVILVVDQPQAVFWKWQRRSYVAGVHRLTGDLLWRTIRPDGANAATPVVAQVAGKAQLLIPGRGALRSYQPETGKELWSCRWPSTRADSSVVTSGDLVYAVTTQMPAEIVCVRGDGAGDVTNTHLVWRDLRSHVGSSILTMAEPWLIVQQDDGTVAALDHLTGRPAWRTRIPEPLRTPPVLLGRQLLCLDERQTLHVLDVDQRGEPVLEAVMAPQKSDRKQPALAQALAVTGLSVVVKTPDGLMRFSSAANSTSGSPSLAIEPQPTRQRR